MGLLLIVALSLLGFLAVALAIAKLFGGGGG